MSADKMLPAGWKDRGWNMKINVPGSLSALFAALIISGCSSITYHKGKATGKYAQGIYRGTRANAATLYLLIANSDEVAGGSHLCLKFFFLFGLIDLPLSVIADTLYLPYDLATLGDASEDLPIRKRLMEEYSPPNQPPVKSKILEELGQPLASAVLSETNINVPKDVMAGVRFAPKGSEVLVYKETNRHGQHFTYFIFISPITEHYIIYFTIVGEIKDDQWPKQPLR